MIECDEEIELMRFMNESLGKLQPSARRRILAWVLDKLEGDEPMKIDARAAIAKAEGGK
jgi:hypothetical protein